MKFLIVTLLIQTFSLFAIAKDIESTLNLFDLQSAETFTLNAQQIIELNSQTISDLENIQLDSREVEVANRRSRVRAITPETAQLVINSIEKNPVTTQQKYSYYNQPGLDLGFCFGRATYVHLLLLKMGVDKRAIKKVWLIGPMKAGAVNWGFHVAIAVKSTTGEWLMIDNVPGRLFNIRQWVDHFALLNKDHKNLRVYTTEPARFGTGPGLYNRLSFGLDFQRQQDWYRHYFLDLMRWFQKTDLNTLGLSDLR